MCRHQVHTHLCRAVTAPMYISSLVVMVLLFCGLVIDVGSEGSLSKATTEENLREELEQEEEAAEEEEHTEQDNEGEMDVDDGTAGATDEGEGKCLRSGVIAERSESRSYGSVTHKCEVREG